LERRRLPAAQLNAARAAFKAGITPARIARQFGLSQSDVRTALQSDERLEFIRLARTVWDAVAEAVSGGASVSGDLFGYACFDHLRPRDHLGASAFAAVDVAFLQLLQ
jgi:hypothetical protein